MTALIHVIFSLQASCAESNIAADEATIDRLTEAFFAKAGKGKGDVLTREEFTDILSNRPELLKCANSGFMGLGFRVWGFSGSTDCGRFACTTAQCSVVLGKKRFHF